MADFTFLFSRKGAIYPLDFSSGSSSTAVTGARSSKNGIPSTLTTAATAAAVAAATNKARLAQLNNEWPYNNLLDATLVHLCCKVLVNMPPKEFDRMTDNIPAELFVPLFKACLYPVRDTAIDILINKWPFKSLVVSRFLSNMFSSIITLYSDTEIGQRTRLGVKYSADIVHSFIDALRNRRTKLRYLDITGLPIAEIIIKYVATHCRLAQKEYQRNCLIDEYLQNVNDLESLCEREKNNNNIITTTTNSQTISSNFIRSDLKKTTSLPDEQLVFRFDCVLQERGTYDELMGALDANALNTRFRMQIAKLDLVCLGKTNIIKLLEKLDKAYIEGLRLQYNSITEESLKDMLPMIGQLRHLRALDLSGNLIDFRQNGAESACLMAATLASLPLLNRIDLSGSPLGGSLSTLLASIVLPLQFLSLHSCGLLDTDLFYLANSKHSSSMEHLGLSENRLTRYSDALIVLLKKCAPNLYALELDDNRFDCIDYLTLICVTRKMPRLKYLTTKGTFEMNDHVLGAEFLHHSTSLVAWRISYPIDIYDPNESDVVAQEAHKRVFTDRINAIIKDKFKLVVNELFF